MALPNINIVQSASGLGRPLATQDHISAYVHYYPSGGTLPSGFSTSDRIKKIFSVQDAENLGITNTSLGETKSVATYEVTTAGAAGDTITITCATIESVKDPSASAVKLTDAYVMKTADVVSTTTAAAAIAAAINDGTNVHGFTATNSTSTVLITAKAGEGIFLNTGTPYVVTLSSGATLAGTLTQPTGAGSTVLGVAGFIDIAHYHISEYFRMQPKGELYVAFYVEESTYAFADITSVINFAQGEIRQVGVYFNNTVFANTQPTALQAVITTAIANDKPFQACLSAEISNTSDLSTLPNLTTLTAPNVSVTIAQDNYAEGYHLFKAVGKSIGSVGTWLGTVSLASVNESIAHLGRFNVSNVEFDNLAFANGSAYKSLSDNLFETLNTYAYTFLRKFTGYTGSFWSDSKTCVTPTSDYATVENNRVYQKISRGARASLLPALSGTIKVKEDGTLSDASIGYYESLANIILEQMEAADEISAYKIVINPSQDVLATSTVELTLQSVPTGIARIIKVNVGFVKSV